MPNANTRPNQGNPGADDGLIFAVPMFTGHHFTLSDDRSGWNNSDDAPEPTDEFKSMQATRLADTPTGSQANKERLD